MASAQTTPTFEPAEVRARILDDHRDIRRRLTAIADHLDAGRIGPAKLAFTELAQRLATHLALENEILPPLLREDFAWGELRAQNLVEHHAAQLTELERLRAALDDADREQLAERLEQFVADLDADMQAEERGVLRPDVLGDEIVTVEFGG